MPSGRQAPWLALLARTAAFLAQVPPCEASVLGAVDQSLPPSAFAKTSLSGGVGRLCSDSLLSTFPLLALPPLATPSIHTNPENRRTSLLGVPSAVS